VNAKPRVGRGQGWSRIEGLSREKILELQALGLNARQIAERLECCPATIFKRLKLARRADEAIAVAEATNRICPLCGGRKWPNRPACNRCVQRQKRGTA
jgi:IS30 family transposase